MYYNGDIISLWHFLSDLLHCYDEEDLYSSDSLSFIPHLAHLILRDIECGILILELSLSEDLKSNFKIEKFLPILTRIIGCPDINPNIKARALAVRVIERCQWRWDGVVDLNDKPVSDELKEDCLREAREAMEIAKQHTFSNTAFYEMILGTVNRCLKLPTDDYWTKVRTQAKSLELRDDLFFAWVFIANRIAHAIYLDIDVVEVEAVFSDVSERYVCFGEFGKLVADYVNHRWKPILEMSTIKAALEATQSNHEV